LHLKPFSVERRHTVSSCS